MNKIATTVVFAALGFMLLGGAFAQIHDPRALEADPDLAEEPIAPVLDGLGDESIRITTDNPKSQQFFNQGLRLTYGFNHSEAANWMRRAVVTRKRYHTSNAAFGCRTVWATPNRRPGTSRYGTSWARS